MVWRGLLHLLDQPVLCTNLLNHLDCALTPVEVFLLVGQIGFQNVESEIQMEFANELETQIDQERKELKKVARKRLEAGANVKAELVYMDFVKQIEKIGDCCFSIAEQLSLTE